MERARKLLIFAGKLYLELGLLSGATLLALAGGNDDLIRFDTRMQQHFNAAQDDADGIREPRFLYFRESLRSPIQLLAVLQARLLMRPLEPFGWAVPNPYESLRPVSGGMVGSTGLTIEGYHRIADTIDRGNEDGVEQIAEGFRTLVLTRREYLVAAMADEHHWRMLLHPAEVVDLDAVVLFSLDLRRAAHDRIYPDILDEGLEALHAPFRIAQWLFG
ncbi:hypothetical protein LMG28138_05698 [Pararobbsia alpina]|uniref:Uncharacterized protein n=2 Tax=Pararobbsia alpina TaxID=621374 RepID=A0A6S7C0U9_9BURK|nr:hypothetical protein LMG28138_05698 [Pararobbsia alpina]